VEEGLGQIVVGADFEAGHTVGLVAEGGEHEHRDLRLASYLAQDVDAVLARQHHVEDHGRVLAGDRAAETLAPVVHRLDVVAQRLQVIAQKPAELLIVVDQQKASYALGRGQTKRPRACSGRPRCRRR